MNNPLVVGYKGQVGRFILDGLLQYMPKASNIWCFDVNDTLESRINRIQRADVIFLCIPLQDTIAWITNFEPYLKDKIIVEQCSLKTELYEKFGYLNFCGMHLLFRPESTPVKDRKCLFVSWTKNNTISDFVQEALKSEVFYILTVQAHDLLMAEQQALPHRAILALADILDESNCNTFIGAEILRLAKRIRNGDKELYEAIQTNPRLIGYLEDYKQRLNTFKF